MILISGIEIEGGAGTFRISATLASDHGPNGELWFEISGAEIPERTMVASAYLAACTPLAAYLEQDLTIDEPIDDLFARYVGKVAAGYGRMHGKRPIAIHASSAPTPARKDRIVAASFSGGVDSFFTLRSHLGPTALYPIGGLATILGFDTPVEDAPRNEALLALTTEVAQALDLRRFVGRTNLRSLFDPYANWGYVTHLGCISCFAFLLSASVHTYLIPSSFPIDNLFPHGSHALLDSSWVSGPVRTVCDAWEFHRDHKTRAIVDWPLAQRYLRVCSRQSSNARNCGECEKCVRTMITLMLLDVPVQPTFPHALSSEILRSLRIHRPVNVRRYRKLVEQINSRPDLAWLLPPLRYALVRGRLRTLRYALRDRLRKKS